jgi:hypothetical protein
VVSPGFGPEPSGAAVELAVQPAEVFFGFECDVDADDFFLEVGFELEGLVSVLLVLAGGVD